MKQVGTQVADQLKVKVRRQLCQVAYSQMTHFLGSRDTNMLINPDHGHWLP